MRAAALCAGLLVALSPVALVQNVPATSASHGAFAFPDQRGARLLVTADLAQPHLLKPTMCTGGRRTVAQFAGRQTAREGGNNRQGPGNFEYLAGSVFTIPAGAIDPDAICFLGAETFLAGSSLPSVAAPVGSGACAQRDRFAKLRDRSVVQCWPLAGLGAGRQLGLIEFERRGKDALASLVLVDGARTIFADYPGEFRGAGQDVWRVDDGGVLSPDGLQVVFMLQRGDWYAMGTAWSGAEGVVLSLWISERGDRFIEALRDTWYRAPI